MAGELFGDVDSNITGGFDGDSRQAIRRRQVELVLNVRNGDQSLMAMSDNETTVGELRKLVEQFVAERDWQPFHTPKNISMALSIEASELMEHFQWLTAEQSTAVGDDAETFLGVREELADVVTYGLALANRLDIDLAATIEEKMEKNRQKYPLGD